MSFKVIRRGTNRKLVYELLQVVYSNFHRITHRFRDTSCSNAANHIFHTPLVSDLEFEGHTVGIWGRNLAPKTRIIGLPNGEEIVIVWGRITWAQFTSVTDGQIYGV